MGRLTSSRPVNKYKCSQGELYFACTIGWNSFKEFVNRFNDLKKLYTLDYAEARLNEVQTAMDIPGFQTRNEKTESLRVMMMKKADECCVKWQALKLYITEAYPKSLLKINLDAAGYEFYLQSASYNWEKIFSLMQSGSQFIEQYSTELMANDNMPATLKGEIELLWNELLEMYKEFMDGMNVNMGITDEKINANNDIYVKLMKMFRDGQHIFRYEPGIRPRFVFAQVMKHISRKNSHEETSSEL